MQILHRSNQGAKNALNRFNIAEIVVALLNINVCTHTKYFPLISIELISVIICEILQCKNAS